MYEGFWHGEATFQGSSKYFKAFRFHQSMKRFDIYMPYRSFLNFKPYFMFQYLQVIGGKLSLITTVFSSLKHIWVLGPGCRILGPWLLVSSPGSLIQGFGSWVLGSSVFCLHFRVCIKSCYEQKTCLIN